MTKQEAYESMKNGNKTTHWQFSDDEYVYMDQKDIIRDESGYNWITSFPFANSPWEERSGFGWETGWSVYNDK